MMPDVLPLLGENMFSVHNKNLLAGESFGITARRFLFLLWLEIV